MATTRSPGLVVPPKSRFRRLGLLYRPVRRRAWAPRLLFYAITFVVLPVLALAALGAFVGPDATLAGVPAVVVVALACVALRRAAIAADGRLRPGRTSGDSARTDDSVTFSLQEPPARHPIQGLLASAGGSMLMVAGFYGLGRIADRGLRLRERGRRLRAVDGRTVLRNRPNDPPVLLLRSFDEEEMREARPLNFFMRRYEESLSRALGRFGPVITIGRPREALAFSGAARLYVWDEEWQAAVRHFMIRAGAVVIVVGKTEGLWWEIAEAFRVVSRERILFVFPYAYKPADPRGQGRSEFFRGWNVWPLRKDMERERRERYGQFRERMAAIIPDALPPDLGTAICLDFGHDGAIRLLEPKYPSAIRYLFGPLAGTHWLADRMFRRYRFDMGRTVSPFVDKLYGTAA